MTRAFDHGRKIARRTLLAAGPALAAGQALASSPPDVRVRGGKAYSESAMVMSVAADGSSAMTLRFCRFPVEGLTWLWCHILVDGQLYAFTRHDLPCTGERLADTPAAAYGAAPLKAGLARTGRGRDLSDVQLHADLRFHRSRNAPHGPGAVHGRFMGRFYPVDALDTQVLEGRDEVYGAFRAQVEIAGRRFVHEGPAKFHEQRQTAPRFETPFCYAWLAGPTAAATTLLIPPGATGGWRFDGVEAPLADMTLDPPGSERRAAWRLKDGRVLPGRLRALIRYEIPIYDRNWQGSFVTGECDGRPVVGAMNDWPGPPDIYAAAATRGQRW
ncbi:hypothetical protein [Phenylobacterium kunshanense]|uniref:DUF1838 domain-containing protein n=1 Tax=Phenylobacterium kunshanense TaxID=1445034 RepID=A0A328BKX7_9CAUL|nr:hypothetical protein [Phenylobacterium kunshanense]RAK65608.1 hypothetical protein DJ019_11665 [Phenylobacterium kunshanense]